jgi:hypothetical protein
MTMCTFVREEELYLQRDSDAPDARVISILPETVPLIAQTDPEDGLYVCSANVLPGSKLSIEDPVATLGACRKAFEYPPEAGGPRLLTKEEQASARVAAIVRLAPGSTGEGFREFFRLKVLPAMRQHPAWRAGLGFATGGAFTWNAACVMAELYDILRFAKDKGRMKARLRSYFRLINAKLFDTNTPLVFTDFLKNQSLGKIRLLHLIRAWSDSPLAELPLEALEKLPYAFLQREMVPLTARYSAQGVEPRRAANLAVYRTTLKYLEFFRLMWLHGLGVLDFDPFRFFHGEWEAFEFEKYVDRIS